MTFTLVSGLTRLVEEMKLYGDLIRQEEGEIRVAVMLTDTGEEASLTLSDKIEVGGRSDEADLRMTMERRVFDEVLRGEADFGGPNRQIEDV